ncbi:MAG: HAMP domain-containing sensor histidine kinase, partial [Pseudomonadota bacterium]
DDIADLGHAVAFSGPPRLPLALDPTLVRRAVTNIIENAVTYGTDVAVTLAPAIEERRGSAVLRIADNGPGIAAADRNAAFEPFWRGDAARGRGRGNDTGFGLGLSIARTIVERHGGTIALHPNEPTGLVVEIVLPFTAPA